MMELRRLPRPALLMALLIASLILASYLDLAKTSTHQKPQEAGNSSWSSSREVFENSIGFLEVGEVYEGLGYPRIRWNPQNPNYTVHYHAPPIYYDIGYLGMPAINLEEALKIASTAANITPREYKLISAYFSPGRIINGNLAIPPEWSLQFVRVFKGYWIWGGLGDYSHIDVTIDAFRGAVMHVSRWDEDLPPDNASFNIGVNSS